MTGGQGALSATKFSRPTKCSFFRAKKNARTFFRPIGATIDLENAEKCAYSYYLRRPYSREWASEIPWHFVKHSTAHVALITAPFLRAKGGSGCSAFRRAGWLCLQRLHLVRVRSEKIGEKPYVSSDGNLSFCPRTSSSRWSSHGRLEDLRVYC